MPVRRWGRRRRAGRDRSTSTFRALEVREFRLLWTAYLVGQLGFWISFIALQSLMARLTDTDGRLLGLLFFASFIPMLIFTPWAGVLADRIDRKRIIVVAFAGTAVLASTLGALALGDVVTPAVLIGFSFVIGSCFSFLSTANNALVANSVPRTHLPSAVSMYAVGTNLSRVAGPLAALPILAWLGEGAAFLLYGGTSAAVVVLLRRVAVTGYAPEVDDRTFLGRVWSGLEHARERPPAMAALVVLAVSSLFAAPYLSLLPVIAERRLGAGEHGFTILAAVTGLGSVLGAMFTGGRAGALSLRGVALLVAGFGASLVTFAASSAWPAALVTVMLVGAFYFAAMTALNVLLQYLTDESKRGRIMSLFLVGWGGLAPIGALWQGEVAEAFGAHVAIGAGGAITVVIAVGIALAPRAGAGSERGEQPLLHAGG